VETSKLDENVQKESSEHDESQDDSI